MMNVKITIEYDGTSYSGWQYQNNAISIQEKIEQAVEILTGEKVKLYGSGRTDAKVHALGQVANFYTTSTIPAERYKYAMNNVLPEDITIVDSQEVAMGFHSRFSASHKRYKYLIYNEELPRALYRNYAYHVRQRLNVEDMLAASRYLIGSHDYTSFMSSHAVVKSTIRTIYDININRNKEFIEIIIEGNSFLRNMVRIIVGTLVNVGRGRTEINAINTILSKKDRMSAGATAPPQGLYLEKVFYT